MPLRHQSKRKLRHLRHTSILPLQTIAHKRQKHQAKVLEPQNRDTKDRTNHRTSVLHKRTMDMVDTKKRQTPTRMGKDTSKMKECKKCQKKFWPKNKRQLYCEPECRIRYWQEQEQKPEARQRQREYRRRPEVKKRKREYQKARYNLPRVKKTREEYQKRPEVRQRLREYGELTTKFQRQRRQQLQEDPRILEALRQQIMRELQ